MAEQKSVECDLCGIESKVPEGEYFAHCKNCNNRTLCSPAPNGRKYIRYSCCTSFCLLSPGRSQIKCSKCEKINLLLPEIAELRCKQPIYASKLMVPYTEIIENLKKSLATAEENEKKAKEESERAKLEVEKQRRTNEIQKQMIEFLQQTNKDQYKGFLETMKEGFYENQSPKAKPAIARDRPIVANPYSRLRPRQPKDNSQAS